MEKVTIKIENMHCMGCVKRAEGALKKIKGLKVTGFDLENKTVSASSKTHIDGGEIVSALLEVGFEATVSINQ